MNLQDLIDKNGLQTDEWCCVAPRFGTDEQLEVVGWSGKDNAGTHKLYILKCNICSQDRELFGDGYFKSLKGHLKEGKVPCGCSQHPKWSMQQYDVLCQRKAKELGYIFLGFTGEWKAQRTKIKMLCEKHGEWSSGCINSLVNMGSSCPGCKSEAIIESVTKPDDVMIPSFFASGAFHPDTKFWRSDRKTKQGFKSYWFMSCPECGETGESVSSNLQNGHNPCACSMHRQCQAYINLVIGVDDTIVAIKFGIANNSKQRIKQQSRVSAYTLRQHSVYTFPDVTSCKSAERECKQTLECGVVLKRDMPDGWTETTMIYNLEKIVEIYQKNGGILNVELDRKRAKG